MLGINSLIIIAPLISASSYIPNNKFAETISYNSFSVEQAQLKDTMNYNTISTEELVRETNEQLLLDILKEEQTRQ